MKSSGPNLDHWPTPPGAVRLFEQYWTPTTDAPREYLIACGLATLCACVENRVWLSFGGERLYPNLWILILGPSSFFRKSTCISKARKTLRRIYSGDRDGPIGPDESSREALLKRMSERGQLLLMYSEFSGALAQFSRDYMAGTKEFLTDMYDSPESYTRLVGAQTFTIRDACVSILAASQTDWFLEKLKGGDIRGGFLARFSFWPAFEKKRFLAVPPEPDLRLGNQLAATLNKVRDVRGAAVLSGPARERYTAWLEGHEHELHGTNRASDLSAFWSRLSVMALKFAVLFQVAEQQSLTVGVSALESSLTLTAYLKRALSHLFQEEFAFTRDMQDRQRVLRLIRNRGAISFRDLLRASSLLKRQLDPVLETLTAEGQIRRGKDGSITLMASELSEPVSSTGTDNVRTQISRVK